MRQALNHICINEILLYYPKIQFGGVEVGTVHSISPCRPYIAPIDVLCSGELPSEKPLTDRDKEYVVLVSEGLTNEQIAWRLHVSHLTVQGQLKTVFRKIPVRSRTELAVLASRHGVVQRLPVNRNALQWVPSDRARELLTHLCAGLSNTEIAWHMDIGRETVKSNVATMLHRLRLRSRVLLARTAIEMGWVK